MSEKSPKNIKNTCKTNIYKFWANSKKAQQVNPSLFKSAQVPWTYFLFFDFENPGKVLEFFHSRKVGILIEIIDSTVEKSGYSEHSLQSFLWMFFLTVNRIKCTVFENCKQKLRNAIPRFEFKY